MDDHGIFVGEKLMLVCGSKEKAEQLLSNYPGGEVWPVEQVNRKWVKKKM